MLALAFSIRGPFGASSAPIETRQPVLDECGSLLAHAFFLWLVVYAVTGLLAPPTCLKWEDQYLPLLGACLGRPPGAELTDAVVEEQD